MHIAANEVVASPLPPPATKRPPFGWTYFAVPPPGGGSATLRWPSDSRIASGSGWLRITTAIDDRERKVIAVRLAGSERMLGELDLRYAHALETFALRLDEADMRAAGAEGVALSLQTATSPLWLTHPCVAAEAPGLAPALLPDSPDTDRASAHLRWLASSNSLHTWGWMEGCVLDALEDLARAHSSAEFSAAHHAHLSRFFPSDGTLRGETPRSEPSDERIHDIEATLMFAALAHGQPTHPWLDRAIDWWLAKRNAMGAIADGTMLSAEGSYTVAYPLARLAAQRSRADLAAVALEQLEIRRRLLWHRDALWLRWFSHDESRTFRNWARAVAWHFVGSVRSARELSRLPEVDLAPIVSDLRRLSTLALATQRPDGLWNCFLDESSTGPDSSGSAGIAAALALAARHGWIENAPACAAARRAEAALLRLLAPDGQLGGVAQSNRGGEELQRSDYRVLSSMGAGLLGQLRAALAG